MLNYNFLIEEGFKLFFPLFIKGEIKFAMVLNLKVILN